MDAPRPDAWIAPDLAPWPWLHEADADRLGACGDVSRNGRFPDRGGCPRGANRRSGRFADRGRPAGASPNSPW
jgi:hypothetical protein